MPTTFIDPYRLSQVAGAGKVFTYIGSNEQSSLSTGSVTFSNEPIGAAASNRTVVVTATIVSGSSSGTFTLSTITVGGSGTTDVTFDHESGLRRAGGIAHRDLDTGTTADIVVTRSGSVSIESCKINVYTLTNLDSSTPEATETNAFATGGGTLTFSLTGTTSGSFIVAAACSSDNDVNVWTVLTEDDGTTLNSRRHTGASLENTTGGTLSPTCTQGDRGIGGAASYF